MHQTITPDYREAITEEQRTRALMFFFGWHGGTVHQLAGATGVDVQTLLYAPLTGAPLTGGFSAIRTCSADWRVERLAPQNQNNWPFWRDALAGFWATGPLDQKYAK